MNYWNILGIAENATIAEIKTAYRKKSLELHPDVNPSPDASKRFIEINNAYRALIDPNFKFKNHAPPRQKKQKPPRGPEPYSPIFTPPPQKYDLWGDPIDRATWKDSFSGQYESDSQTVNFSPRFINRKEKIPEVDLWKQMPKDPMVAYWKEYDKLKHQTAYEDPELFWKKLDDWMDKNIF